MTPGGSWLLDIWLVEPIALTTLGSTWTEQGALAAKRVFARQKVRIFQKLFLDEESNWYSRIGDIRIGLWGAFPCEHVHILYQLWT